MYVSGLVVLLRLVLLMYGSVYGVLVVLMVLRLDGIRPRLMRNVKMRHGR